MWDHRAIVRRPRQDPAVIRRLLRARDRMAAAPEQDWPVLRLAKVSGVCEAHFARSFKQAFGVPPHRYLLTLRLERAKTLLRETDVPITDIAFACGWNSLGSFGRTFRDVVGESPSAFRARGPQDSAEVAPMPACVLRAALRPDLAISVLEKRRREQAG